MPNMSPFKVSMPEQKPEIRNKNFREVTLGYTLDMAKEEALRCLQCKHQPCVSGCPVGVQIPDFIKLLLNENIEDAYYKIKETNSLPAICGRVCPQENQCEAKCVRGIKHESVAIGRLERFVSDWYIDNVNKDIEKTERNGKKVAVLGAGPAGLTCAGDLANMGYDVTIFEAFHAPGGVLVYGIPEFRLPKSLVKKEISLLKDLGVNIMTNMVIGKTLSIDEIFDEGYEAVFIGSGAGLPRFMEIPGENLNGVFSSNEFLTRINLMKAYLFPDCDTPVSVGDKVAVIGGGNVAMDAARSAKRLGAKDVYIIYRRTEKEMPARAEEIHHAKEEGINIMELVNPVEIISNDNGWVGSIKMVKMKLGEPDDSGRRRPIETDEFVVMEMDTVIVAIGQRPNPMITSTTKDLKTHKWGGIVADDKGQTSKEGVFAGGDIVTGAATVILAMGAGKTAAISIDKYIKNKAETK